MCVQEFLWHIILLQYIKATVAWKSVVMQMFDQIKDVCDSI